MEQNRQKLGKWEQTGMRIWFGIFVARAKAKRLGEDWSFVEWSILESVQ